MQTFHSPIKLGVFLTIFRITMLRFFCFLTTVITATATQSSEEKTIYLVPLTRSGAIQLSLQRNLDLQAARYAIQRAEAASIDEGALPNTKINVSSASDFAFNNEGEHMWSVGLSQQFPVTGRLRWLRSLAVQEIALAKIEVQVAELELAAKVATVFDALEANLAEVQLLNQQLTLNLSFQQFLQIKVKRAEASSLDIRQAQLVAAALRQKTERLERRRAQMLADLKRLLAIESDEALELAKDPTSLPQELPIYQRDALVSHPDFALKQQFATIASTRSDLALARRWSDIAVELFFQEAHVIDEPIGIEQERFLGIGVSIPLPLQDRNRGQIESNRQYELQIDLELKAMVFRLLNEAESLRVSYLDVQDQIENYGSKLLAPAETNLAELEQAYGAGLIDLTEVFRAQERLLDLRLELLELKTERASLLTQWRATTAHFLL